MRKFESQIQEYIYKLLSKTLDDNQVKLLNTLLDIEYSNGIDSFVQKLRKNNTLIKQDIYTRDKERGKEYINLLVGEKEIVKVKETKDEYVVECVYDIYRIVKPTENARANKCHYVHIDSELLNDEADLIKMIKHTSILGKARFGIEGSYVRYF